MEFRKKGPVIAIDGPAGTGKSSTTQRLAEELGFTHVDTGAIYRCVALLCYEGNVENFPDKCGDIAQRARIEFKTVPTQNPAKRVFLNARDVTGMIRTPQISNLASKISAYPPVRKALLGLQRQLGCEGKTILEGRDIGTVIFPDADVKFFLTADVAERARRRALELEAKGKAKANISEVQNQIQKRDQADSSREVAPLAQAPDAVVVDTSSMSLDEVVELMKTQIRQKLGL